MCNMPVDTTCCAFEPMLTSEGGLSTMAILGVVALAICFWVMLALRRSWE
jgi:hypothetical protein